MRPEFAKQSGFVLPTKLVLPNSDHRPAEPPQLAVDAAVAGLVAGDLGQPERRPGLGPSGVFGATMPEAAVYEDSGLERGEDEVRPDGERFRLSFLLCLPSSDYAAASPSRDAICPEYLAQSQLGVLVSRPTDASHHIGALLSGEDIGHGKELYISSFPGSQGTWLWANAGRVKSF